MYLQLPLNCTKATSFVFRYMFLVVWSFNLHRFLSLLNPIGWMTICVFCLSSSAYGVTDKAQDLFSGVKQSILQIRVIDLASGSKSAIGSGFVINGNGLLATNYHVVEQKVSKPDKYRVEYMTNTNQTGELRLVDVDVVNG